MSSEKSRGLEGETVKIMESEALTVHMAVNCYTVEARTDIALGSLRFFRYERASVCA